MALAITISPEGQAWVLRSRPLGLEAIFRSGGRAEAAGRRLAERLARAGHDVELEITLRDGASAGRLPYPARRAAAQSSSAQPSESWPR